jgi:hypothetical protein
MAKKDPFKELMSNIDWTRLVPILSPLIVFGAWLLFSKFDKRADAVSKLIAICEPIPAIDLNVPKPVVLASLYHALDQALDILEDVIEFLQDVNVPSAEEIIEEIKKEGEEAVEKTKEETADIVTQFINLFRPSTWESVKEFGK